LSVYLCIPTDASYQSESVVATIIFCHQIDFTFLL